MKLIKSFFDSEQDFIKTSAEYILAEALSNISEKDFFTIALTGGSTPIKIYETLASSPLKEKFPWAKTYFFLSDERILPKDNVQSNIYMINQTLFSKINILKENKFFPNTSLKTPEKIAQDYESNIKDFFKNEKASFDLILLGMGLDCHSASLFPEDNVWKTSKNLIISTSKPAGEPKVHRISIGLPLINQSKNILMLTSGQAKKEIAQRLLSNLEKSQSQTNSPIYKINNIGNFIWHIC